VKHPHRLDHTRFRVPTKGKFRLRDHDPRDTGEFSGKKEARAALADDVAALAEAQELLWASAQHSVLIIFQAMDAAGKDGAIKHVMSGVNPQGCDVHSFKAPSDEERLHHFLWRPAKVMPARGRIAIFNRSYYEETLVVRVHPELLVKQWLPAKFREGDMDALWPRRFEEINAFEKLMSNNGIRIIKFFLNVSKAEQRQRFFDRLNNPDKNWKFSAADIRERGFWDDYQHAFENMLKHTSTSWAPWYVIPADHKWFTRACVADIIVANIEALGLEHPRLPPDELDKLADARRELESEDGG